jgi:dihydropteroate synthase
LFGSLCLPEVDTDPFSLAIAVQEGRKQFRRAILQVRDKRQSDVEASVCTWQDWGKGRESLRPPSAAILNV